MTENPLLTIRDYTDEHIVDGILMLDHVVYEYLDRTFRKPVINHVCRNSGTAEEGEEHYQDVIFEIYLNIESGKYNLGAARKFKHNFWLIAKFRWIDKLRKKKKIKTTEFTEATMDIPIESEEEKIAGDASNALILLINKYLKDLTKEEQEYINLYYYSKQSLQFIANYFGTTYDYSRLKLHRIRKKIRKLVESDPEYDGLPQLLTS